ncbi:MAG: S1 RNA-binding domain-containing protein [Candidatus Hadarchaeum sp.]
MSNNVTPIGKDPVPLGEEEQTHSSLSTHAITGPSMEETSSHVVQRVSSTTDPGEISAPVTQRPVNEDALAAAPASTAPAQSVVMQQVLSDEYAYVRPKRGEIRLGKIMDIRQDSILVDLGLKHEGIIPAEDLQRVGQNAIDSVAVGDEIPVYIIRPEGGPEGSILVSWYRARQEQDWLDAQRLYETGEIWEGKVKGYNRGGLIVPYGKIRGFVPASQITGISRNMNVANLQERLAKMVGQTLHLKVIEVDRQSRRLIFSERIAQREWRTQQREKLLNELQEGTRLRGVVSNVCDFGVFVDLGGTDGLVHISELSWRRTKHPSDLVKVGDEVEVCVLHVDKENKRIALSLRLAEPDPWQTAMERYKVGQLVTATITKLATFGAFAALNDGIEGLIHISELAEIPPKHPSEVVKIGDTLLLRIIKIDNQRRRMGLSLKRVSEEERAAWEEQQAAETQSGESAKPSGKTQLESQQPLAKAVEKASELMETMPPEPSNILLPEGPVPNEEDTDNLAE